ncbi:uncharacterized protein LOC118797735 [Colossoma macropomum]|uniref:uncharacterized protein LOC118797735 n=1 Tax=Colossoma macropomum TaxID=42526 RepID=UPI00186533C5|nr:uncharacterized protein LOC118797735 [Colossoma macropomum]
MALLLIFLLMITESAQCCRGAAGVREERSEAVSYSNSDCLMGSRLCNQLFHASYVSGAFGTEWSVKYNQQEICALKGSTVFMNGTYTHPEGLTVTETFWFIDLVPGVGLTDLSKNPDYSGRVEYLADEQKPFSLKLSDVMKKDEHQFCFRIITNVNKEKWQGKPGVQLRVTELHVETPEEVTEGETADLTCKTTCSLTDPTFIWYKNGRPLTTKTIKNNQLHLQTVSSEDAGSYSCAVRGYQHLQSTAHNLRVRYPPKNVSVSISSSGDVLVGFSVNLTCSSDANPPVENHMWFKEGHSVILYSPAGVGLCEVAVFLTVFFWMRRKRQSRNMDDPDYVNTGLRVKPPDDDSCSVNVYENMTKEVFRGPAPDDDSSSAQDYENITNTGLNAPPPDDDSSSTDDYVNITDDYENVTLDTEDIQYETYIKYLCRGECSTLHWGTKDIPAQSGSAEDQRFSLDDHTADRVFTITITDLRTEDEGTYWCGIQRTKALTDLYTEILLLVKPGDITAVSHSTYSPPSVQTQSTPLSSFPSPESSADSVPLFHSTPPLTIGTSVGPYKKGLAGGLYREVMESMQNMMVSTFVSELWTWSTPCSPTCIFKHNSNTIMKFADDTTVVDLIKKNMEE